THGMYQQKIYLVNPNELTDDDREKHRNTSIVVKFDVTASSDFKIQIEHWQDFSGSWFKQNYGDADTFSMAYNLVF
ncbi:MAG: hypothetical protein J0M22_18105, partial [Gammaproteobacteria bacterium]|nr:hypothetical protein [Gammaproteobacteria bacterium]